ncbi:MAG: sulfite reductase flavoprotein alpha-component [Sphingomonadales bacterium]|jgi:sulfite reductase (NADPH) flavoprotein alpha-component|nr:sulfite reductase flavoprotein alpha-component [Sphingomonadales bacterium]
MTARALFPADTLNLDQRRHVEALSGSVTPEQARWISGYFAGLEAGIARLAGDGGALSPEAPRAARTLTVLHGGETGNCAGLARMFAAAARERDLTAEIVDMARYKPRRLREEQDLLVIVSTHGEGDPPQPALDFFEYVEGPKAPKLPELRYAVLALGDSSYEHYCEAGKRLDRRLEALGAGRLAPRADCDVDFDETAAQWSAEALALLAAQAGAGSEVSVPADSAFPAATAHDKRNPFDARIIENLVIVGRDSTKETRHIELDIAGSGLAYDPGDAIGIVARNDPAVVEALLDAAGLSGDAGLTVKGEATSLADALEGHFEIALTPPRFLDHWAALTGAAPLRRLAGEEGKSERLAWLRAHHVVDIVRRFPLGGLDAETFVAGLRPLQPRLYSIASSLSAMPDEAHVTLAPVRYQLHGEPRHGVASAHLADRGAVGGTLPVYIQPNEQFRLPEDDKAIVMIGAGTGIAPYRAFLQEREARGAGGGSWLFFGERNFRSDFLYQTEWQAWLKDGLLSRMDVAFSRDRDGRTYVQHRMLERSADLYAWLEEGAHLYVCGDAVGMAPDVHDTLVAIVAEQGGYGRERAEDYVRDLQRSRRYQRDVY